jgi:two-component system, OmpR family, phosphate regulon sensor histidine kinase PhoR
MKRRFTFVFTLAALTVAGILLFQLYWVYNSYRTERRNFDDKIANALQTSIDAYAIQASALPTTLKENDPYLSVMQSYEEDSSRAGRGGGSTAVLRNVLIKPLQVGPDNLNTVRGMIARLSMQAFNKPIQLTVLDTIFRKELKKNQIDLAFRLVLKGGQTMPEAIFPGKRQYLFRRTVVPALVSVLLILLSVGSLLYMGFIIRRLVRLDSTKNDFINNIAHELRTPLAILKSTHEALYTFKGDSDPEKLRRYLVINFGVLDRLDANVDRLLDSMNYEQGNRKPTLESVELDALIKSVVSRLDPDGRVGIRLESDPAPFEVVTDSYIIETVLTNLVDNALKYSNGGSGVLIRIDTDGDGWQLRVKDEGQGIASEHLPFIFDKFYRVPAGNLHEVKGYGIGLSYVKQLVTTLGGRIGVKSVVNKGTEFTLQFPRHG